jgi:hypothetical protein
MTRLVLVHPQTTLLAVCSHRGSGHFDALRRYTVRFHEQLLDLSERLALQRSVRIE